MYFALTISLLHPRRVRLPVNTAGSSAPSGYSPSPAAPRLAAPCKAQPLQTEAPWLCGLLLSGWLSSTDRPFWLLNVTGLAKEQPRVNSQGGDKNRHETSWVRAGRRGNSLPLGFGNAPEERSLEDFSLGRRNLLQCGHGDLPPL